MSSKPHIFLGGLNRAAVEGSIGATTNVFLNSSISAVREELSSASKKVQNY